MAPLPGPVVGETQPYPQGLPVHGGGWWASSKHSVVRWMLPEQGLLDPNKSIRKAWVLKGKEAFSLWFRAIPGKGSSLAMKDSC